MDSPEQSWEAIQSVQGVTMVSDDGGRCLKVEGHPNCNIARAGDGFGEYSKHGESACLLQLELLQVGTE